MRLVPLSKAHQVLQLAQLRLQQHMRRSLERAENCLPGHLPGRSYVMRGRYSRLNFSLGFTVLVAPAARRPMTIASHLSQATNTV